MYLPSNCHSKYIGPYVCAFSLPTFKQVKGVVRFKLNQSVSDMSHLLDNDYSLYIKARVMSITGSSSVCILLQSSSNMHTSTGIVTSSRIRLQSVQYRLSVSGDLYLKRVEKVYRLKQQVCSVY